MVRLVRRLTPLPGDGGSISVLWEDGVEVTCTQLVEAAYKGAGRAWPSPSSISDIPTPLDLQHALLAAKHGKACGPDAIPGELGLLFASGTQKLLYTL